MQTLTLNNGNIIPSMGIGTFTMSSKQAEQSVLQALQDGYRLIDTANIYMNEKAVGRAVKRSGINREDIFISTKLWPSVYKDEQAVEKTLNRLDTDYIDLLFLHQPAGNWKAGYRQLEQAYEEGKIRNIGISNFTPNNIKELLSFARIRPQIMQLENHPYFTADKERQILPDAAVMAWYPLGHGDKKLLKEPVFTGLSEKYHKTNAQIILRWHIQYGNIVIPGSTNPEHIRENADIFDFTLTSEEMKQIALLNKNKRYYHTNPVQTAAFSFIRPNFESQA